jgi:hypothetical protein
MAKPHTLLDERVAKRPRGADLGLQLSVKLGDCTENQSSNRVIKGFFINLGSPSKKLVAVLRKSP